jgi:adenosylcobinamide-GDP ribazoletransferase
MHPAALAVPCIGALCLALLHPFARSQFGGMSGDLAGFFLQCAELAMLVALVVVCKVVGL